MTAPVLGQPVIVKIQSSPLREVPAIVTLVIDEDEINAVGSIDINDDWPSDGPGDTHPNFPFFGITRGSGLNQWRDADLPPPVNAAIAGAVDGLASETYTDNAQAACLAVPGSGSAVSLTLNNTNGIQLSTTRPCLLVVRGTGACTVNATGTVAYAVQLLDGSTQNTPSPANELDRADGSFGGTVVLGLALTDTDPWKLVAYVPTGRWVRVIQPSGAGVVAITSATKWVL